ncbi:MAG: hypothetical protein MUE73_12890 [Planctomycetes bacterium]|nr:hypothetical protein [Planctomycetota bacterium]
MAYGTDEIAGDLKGGAGGGQGGSVLTQFPSGSTVYFYIPGTGGGGGGAFRMYCQGKLTLGATGMIDMSGGAGGYGYGYVASSNTTYGFVNSGAGGGGAGGSVHLICPDLDLQGIIDVRGGAGGVSYDAYYGQYGPDSQTWGGQGSGGRLAISSGKNVWLAAYAAAATGSATISISTAGTSDWTISADTTMNTDTGTYTLDPSTSPAYSVPGWNSTEKAAYVRHLTVNQGTKLTVRGSKAFLVYASGNVAINGTIDARGGGFLDTAYSGGIGSGYGDSTSSYWMCRATFTYTYNNFHLYLDPRGGPGGPGGGQGGANGAKDMGYGTSYSNGIRYYMTSLPNAEAGYGYNGTSGGAGGGGGGLPDTSPSLYSTYYYHYGLSGAGAGGNSVGKGTNGWNNTCNYSSYTLSGTSGTASASQISVTSLSFSNVPGGGGGGGGAFAGYIYSTSTRYIYGRWAGCGGGGGGNVSIGAAGSITLNGTIDAQGGNGRSWFYYASASSSYPVSSMYAYYSAYYINQGAGGGGGGGNLRLHAQGGVTVGASASVNLAGGLGGRGAANPFTTDNNYTYNKAGNGGKGGLYLTAPTAPTLPELALDPTKIQVGLGGELTTPPAQLMDTGVTTWIDSGAAAPNYTSMTWYPTSDAIAYIQGAHSQYTTGAANTATATAWIPVPSGSAPAIDGYRFFRIKLVLQLKSPLPALDYVTVNHSYTVN